MPAQPQPPDHASRFSRRRSLWRHTGTQSRIRYTPETTFGRSRLARGRIRYDDVDVDERPPTEPAERPPAPEPGGGALGWRPRPRRPSTGTARGVTTAAVVVAVAAGAGILGIVAGLLTLFGWGLAIVVAILAVGVSAAIHPRPANGWLLVPMLALALPAAAVAISGVRVLPGSDRVVVTPTTATQIPDDGYRAGLGDLLVDLRSFDADDGDRIAIPAGSDLGRTVVALPQDRCFNLDVRWRTGNLRLPRVREHPAVKGLHPRRPLLRAGAQRPPNRKRTGTVTGRIALFGRAYAIDQGRWVAASTEEHAPTLTLELESDGGSFVVRDYPDHVSPLHSADWPIDRNPPLGGPPVGSLAPAIRREARVIVAERRRARRFSGPPIEAEALRRLHFRWKRQNARQRKAFARTWARSVVGTCNSRGSFR